MKRTAVIDIDNTLWQFCDALYGELTKGRPDFPPVERWIDAEFWKPFCSTKTFLATIDRINSDQNNDRFLPYPEARPFLETLRKEGFRIIIASHRRPETRSVTEAWLRRHGLVHDELHLSFDKTVLFDKAAAVVDDAPATLEQAAACGARAAGLLFPWNKAYVNNGFMLFPNLDQVLPYLLAPGPA